MIPCQSHIQGKLQWKTFPHSQLWFLLRSRVKTYVQKNKASHVVDTHSLWGLPWPPGESPEVFTWPPQDSLMISMWCSSYRYLITLSLSSNKCFHNKSRKLLIFDISALVHWPIRYCFLTVLAKGPHSRIVLESHLKLLRAMLTMSQHFWYTIAKLWLQFP